jgi:uncharacterized protein YgfB (UPF0149 family)
MTDVNQFATIPTATAREMCGDILGYVQAGQSDPVLYQMVVDLKNALDAMPEGVTPASQVDVAGDPWAEDVDMDACPDNCPRCLGKE